MRVLATATDSQPSLSRFFGLGLLLGAALVVTLTVRPSWGKEQLTPERRINLIRGLVKEVAVAKVTLPRGKRGIRVNEQGQLDEERARAEIQANGVAIRPGMPVEITQIRFRSNQILLDINGGGKRGKKWYQRIQISVGARTAPAAQDTTPVVAQGSYIALVFPNHLPDLTVAEVKQLLGQVLDFERRSPTVLYKPELPPEIREAIKNHQVIVGMDRDAVLSSKGRPDRRVREVRDGVEREEWIYGLPPNVLFVTFDGDTVVSVRQHGTPP